jgi:hypothetical protein
MKTHTRHIILAIVAAIVAAVLATVAAHARWGL